MLWNCSQGSHVQLNADSNAANHFLIWWTWLKLLYSNSKIIRTITRGGGIAPVYYIASKRINLEVVSNIPALSLFRDISKKQCQGAVLDFLKFREGSKCCMLVLLAFLHWEGGGKATFSGVNYPACSPSPPTMNHWLTTSLCWTGSLCRPRRLSQCLFGGSIVTILDGQEHD